jgi:hypothetical protein
MRNNFSALLVFLLAPFIVFSQARLVEKVTKKADEI